jgi:hypothetical protein
MEPTVPLTADTIASIGMDRLAALVLDHAAQDELLARKLELAIAAATPDIDILIARVRSDIALTRQDNTFYGYYQAGQLADDLEATRRAIVEDVLPRSPCAAADLLAEFVHLDRHVMEQCDDSDGRVGMVIQEAVEDLGRAWAAVPDGDLGEMADLVLELVHDNDYGVHERVVTAFKDALDVEGLIILEQRVRERLSVLSPTDGADTNEPDIDQLGEGDPFGEQTDDERGGPGAQEARRHSYERSTLFGLLKEIADIRGDVDGYIALLGQTGSIDYHIRDIVERLLRADRYQDALDWIAREGADPRRDLSDLHIQALERLDRRTEAQGVRWAVFRRTLSLDTLNAFLERVADEGERQAAITRAVGVATGHPSRSAALRVLATFVPAAAEDYIVAHHEELNGDLYGTLRPIAEALADAHPLASVLLYRRLTDAVLERKASQHYRYRHAVRDLLAGDRLAAAVPDWRGQPTQGEYRQALAVEHKRKRSFWVLLQEAGQPN